MSVVQLYLVTRALFVHVYDTNITHIIDTLYLHVVCIIAIETHW